MSKHWNPGGKVVRGRFGQRRPSANAGSTRWLSAQDYAALSPSEKRVLHFARQEQRRSRTSRAWRGKPRRASSGPFVPMLIAFATVVYLTYGNVRFGIRDVLPQSMSASAPLSADFSYCKWGGGTNCVVDGDTFFINGAKVRIANIDAPETHDYRCESELQLGEQAASRLQALLNSGSVTMTSIDRDRDAYGRLLRNVSVGGRDVGAALITAGVARAYAGGRRPWC